MKNQFFIQFFIFGLLTIANGFFSQDSLAQTKNSYKCIQLNGKPTTIVDTARGRIQLIVWQSDFFRDSGWTPQKRCNEVTKRFQQFSDSGSLRYIATGTMNQQPVICVAEKKSSGFKCRGDGLLLTLQPKDNPSKVLTDLFNMSARTSTGGLSRGGVLDLDSFLATASTISSDNNDNLPTSNNNSLPPTIISNPETNQKPKDNPSCPPILCP
ncbi:COP23 domain-containing protein [Cyanobacterium aponinum]|uniref:COP23 domain-containing protein n=1 Tax=Cyanobacterium aponinum TaxID=379064 RepID=UPI000C12DB7C|nr:COP23 domain-containing protein [Cyanobacterium aponinum]PHV62584.1 hypothetical protein CSQ80_09990 [Cyanobacterium aponinum IPPAS B-1201]